ncbi:tetraspanin-3 isoform X1 [Latimeria chalumnae]|uniref:tetraspanin-3 isoform X1 n=1 Tax=Latimeria chalumnae TaxID=7897 RepID=UPI0003C12FD8|nr:PREDICTED: tetraspanin-3-like isoform X1 [Latimeria chalumnae]|eukprot:XP_005989933.1 PREDICTED: tetraspanin-3-like isoform X1 [Latimeria chalumnae]
MLCGRKEKLSVIDFFGEGDRWKSCCLEMWRCCQLSLGLLSLCFWCAAFPPVLFGSFLLLTCWSLGYFLVSAKQLLLLPALLSVCLGPALFLVGVLGYCVVLAKGEARCRKGSFMYVTVFLLCLEATTGLMAFVYTKTVGKEFNSFEDIFNNYNSSNLNPDTRAVDSIQKQLMCCGVQNYTDWEGTPWYQHSGNGSVPHSCCIKMFQNCTGDLSHPELLYQKGCQTMLEQRIHRLLMLIVWASVAALCVQEL